MPLPEHLTAGLDRGWLLLPDVVIGAEPPVGIVLLHPWFGVALLEVAPHWTEDAPARLRQRLELARFAAIFPGHLPVVHHMLRPAELPALPGLLAAAFAAQPPLDLPGGDAWAVVVQRALRGQPMAPPRRRAAPLAAGVVALLGALVVLGRTGAMEAGADGAARPVAPVSTGLVAAALAASPPPKWPVVLSAATGTEAPLVLSQATPSQPAPAPQARDPAIPPPTARPAADPVMLGALLRRGEALLAIGDVSAARLFFERAAAAGSAAGAEAMGRTYDPAVLATLGARGIRPDPAAAANWYRRARELGASAATENTR